MNSSTALTAGLTNRWAWGKINFWKSTLRKGRRIRGSYSFGNLQLFCLLSPHFPSPPSNRRPVSGAGAVPDGPGPVMSCLLCRSIKPQRWHTRISLISYARLSWEREASDFLQKFQMILISFLTEAGWHDEEPRRKEKKMLKRQDSHFCLQETMEHRVPHHPHSVPPLICRHSEAAPPCGRRGRTPPPPARSALTRPSLNLEVQSFPVTAELQTASGAVTSR